MVRKTVLLSAIVSLCLLFLPHLSHAAWQWENPLPLGATLNDAWGSSSTNIFVAGELGTVLRYNGTDLIEMDPGTDATLTSVWGVPGGKVYFGSAGLLYVYDQGTAQWSTVKPTGVNNTIAAITGLSESDIWVIAGGGSGSYFNGSTWTPFDANGSINQNMPDIAAVSSSLVYAVDVGGRVFYSDDGSATWSSVAVPATSYYTVWADSTGDVVIAGAAGQAYLCTSCDPTAAYWTTLTNGGSVAINDLWGNSLSDIYAVGTDGVTLHYDGNGSYAWSNVTPVVPVPLYGVYADPSGGMAVGQTGAVQLYDGSTWTAWGYSAVYEDLYGIAQGSSGDLYVVGDGGTIGYFDGASWALTGSGIFLNMKDVWVSPTDTVYAVGGAGPSGVIATGSGSSWTTTTWPQVLMGIHGFSDSDIYVSGNNGTILHNNGSGVWTTMTTPAGLGFIYDLWGSDPTEMWAVTGGKILLSSGGAWSVAHTISPDTYQILSVWGSAADDVYAVGDQGSWTQKKVLHYDGDGWSEIDLSSVMPSFTGAILSKVWGTGPDNVFFVGDYGTVFRYDGANWHLLDQPFNGTIRSAGGDTITVAGDNGSILTYTPDCPAGEYLSGEECVACPTGSYCPGNDSAYQCPAGEYASDVGSTSCYPCLVNYYSDTAGSSACTPCPADSFTDGEGAVECLTCPPGTEYGGGAECNACPAGYVSAGGADTCTACPAGTEASADQASCVDCPAGRYNSTPGGLCAVCPTGSVSFGGAEACMACPSGTYSSAEGDLCLFCDAGTYSAGGTATCDLCPEGTYSDMGSESCTQCDAGTYSTEGSVSCVACDAGSYSAAGSSTCDTCDAGTYSSAGASTCDPCAAGSFSAAGASDCTLCPVGQYAPGTGSDSCQPCPAGGYAPAEGYQACDVCDPGTFSLSGAGDCTLCDAGSFSAMGSSACDLCDAGTYSAQGASTCTDCLSGSVSSSGADLCTECQEGTEASADASTCILCPTGSYNAVAGSTCQLCPEGTYSDVTGAVLCADCPEGYTADPGSSECVPVPSGGGGGGGGCNTTGPRQGEPMWPEVMWITLLGMVIMWRRKKAVHST